MKMYKAFNPDMTCRGFKYEVGKKYAEDNAEMCNRGFHACERPLDVLNYYPPTSRFAEVELEELSDETSSDTKRVGKKIKIKTEIGIQSLVKAQIEYVKKTSHETIKKGDFGAATAGDRGAAIAGDRGAATAGDRGAATSRGKSASGENGLSVTRGNGVSVKGGLGALLVIAEEKDDDYGIKECKVAVVDGENIKPDTWYRLDNGEFTEVEE